MLKIDTRIQPRLQKIKGMSNGVQRVIKRIAHEHVELFKDIDKYHRELLLPVRPKKVSEFGEEDRSV